MSSNQQLLLGEGAGGGIPNFIEDVFSTYLYTGNSSTQTITNNIDLSTKGGLVWLKARSAANHGLVDTVRGFRSYLSSDSTAAAYTNVLGYDVTAFNANGFSLGPSQAVSTNTSGITYASWTFRKQPKFFTQGTFTGDGTTNKVITHDLNATTGFIIVKRTDDTGNWQCWHRTFTNKQTIFLNTTGAVQTYATADDITVTNTSFTVGTNQLFGNGSGFVYVYYVFAHDAGGFGLAGTDNVISCGSVVNTGNPQVTLGYEPQWVLFKSATSTSSWYIVDNMRGLAVGQDQAVLLPNSSVAEVTNSNYININATGFTTNSSLIVGETLIYIAIRRGPMKVPTVGTSVYNAIARTGTGAAATVTGVGFAPDLMIVGNRTGVSGVTGHTADRLRGKFTALRTNAGVVEISDSSLTTGFLMDGVSLGDDSYDYGLNKVMTYVNWFFKRAPGFFDEVCYTGTGVATTQAHNLGAVPEMMIVKRRNAMNNWAVYTAALGNTNRIFINQTGASAADSTLWNNTTPTNSVFTIGTAFATNNSGDTYVAYLFATCAGVSKVGSYTGNGSSQTIACGFTAGSRFVLIKRTDSTGDWYVWDSARGIVAGNDPHLSLNDAAAEVTTDDSVDTDNSGFIVNQDAATNVNVTSATYIFLAIA